MMRICLCLILLLVPFYSIAKAQVLNFREFITPLHTTRTQVEERFGKAQGSCKCIYETQNETIKVTYAENVCEKGWNVPKDRVLEFTVTLKSKIPFNSLKVDLSNFIEVTNDVFFSTYTDLQKGIRFSSTSHGEVEGVRYMPTSSNALSSKLRCPNFPKYNPMNEVYSPAAKFRIKKWEMNLPDLDNLRLTFEQFSNYRLYLFLYFSKETSESAKIDYIRKINGYFRYENKLTNKQVKIVNGGIRDSSEVVAFILPDNYPEPTALPKHP